MGNLDFTARKHLPAKDFGLPGQRKYPEEDKPHAINAEARATQMVKRGKLSRSSEAKIDRKADRVIDEDSQK